MATPTPPNVQDDSGPAILTAIALAAVVSFCILASQSFATQADEFKSTPSATDGLTANHAKQPSQQNTLRKFTRGCRAAYKDEGVGERGCDPFADLVTGITASVRPRAFAQLLPPSTS